MLPDNPVIPALLLAMAIVLIYLIVRLIFKKNTYSSFIFSISLPGVAFPALQLAAQYRHCDHMLCALRGFLWPLMIIPAMWIFPVVATISAVLIMRSNNPTSIRRIPTFAFFSIFMISLYFFTYAEFVALAQYINLEN